MSPTFLGVMFLLAAGLLLASLTDGWGDWISWVTLLVGFVAFATIRAGMTPGPGDAIYSNYVIRIDTLGGLVPVPAVWLQGHLRSRLLDVLTSAVYLSYFIVPQVVALILWLKGGPLARFAAAGIVLYGIALLVHHWVPTSPPWLASGAGQAPPMDRILVGVLRRVSPALTEAGYGASANDVAAMPSVHEGMTVLSMMAMARLAPRTRPGAWAYSIAMLFSIAYLGEHYLVDGLAGALCAWIGWQVARPLDPSPRRDPEEDAGVMASHDQARLRHVRAPK